jgi:hypothetical protein
MQKTSEGMVIIVEKRVLTPAPSSGTGFFNVSAAKKFKKNFAEGWRPPVFHCVDLLRQAT